MDQRERPALGPRAHRYPFPLAAVLGCYAGPGLRSRPRWSWVAQGPTRRCWAPPSPDRRRARRQPRRAEDPTWRGPEVGTRGTAAVGGSVSSCPLLPSPPPLPAAAARPLRPLARPQPASWPRTREGRAGAELTRRTPDGRPRVSALTDHSPPSPASLRRCPS